MIKNGRVEIKGIEYIEKCYAGKDYVAAKILINISPTLYGIKPATLINFSNRRGRDLIRLWDIYKKDITLGGNIEFIELKRDPANLVVLFYHRRNLTRQLFNGKHTRFLERFGYNREMSLHEMLSCLKARYHTSCPHEIGLFLGIPLKDVLGYLQMIPLQCSYSGYWKVYGNPDKTKRLFQRYRSSKQQVIYWICSGKDPVSILKNPPKFNCNFTDQQPLIMAG